MPSVLFPFSWLVYIYAPSNGDQRVEFYDSLYQTITTTEWYGCNSVVLLGDFNVVEDPNLDRSHLTYDQQKGVFELCRLQDLLVVHDVYREGHPNCNDFFTFFSDIHGTQSRIDRIYLSMNMLPGALCTARTESN